jgi:hypothetical protein
MSEDNQQEKNKDKKPQESIEEFCKKCEGFAVFVSTNLGSTLEIREKNVEAHDLDSCRLLVARTGVVQRPCKNGLSRNLWWKLLSGNELQIK